MTGFNLILCYYALGDKDKMQQGFVRMLSIQQVPAERSLQSGAQGAGALFFRSSSVGRFFRWSFGGANALNIRRHYLKRRKHLIAQSQTL